MRSRRSAHAAKVDLNPLPSPQPRKRRPRIARGGAGALPGTPIGHPRVLEDARRADRSIRLIGVIFLLVTGGLLLWTFANVFLIIFAGLLFAVFLTGIAGVLERYLGMPPKAAYFTVVGTLAAVVIAGGLFLGNEIARQLDQLGPVMHQAWEDMLNSAYRYEWGRIVFSERNLRAILPADSQWIAHVTGAFSTTLGVIAGFVIALFIGLYGAATPHVYRRGFLLLMPAAIRPRTGAVLNALGSTMRWWLIGTFLRMTVVGTLVTVGLWLLDIPLALALGLIAFVMDFVPYIGPILALLPALLVALPGGATDLVAVLLLYLAVQSAENYVVTPLIDQYSVSLPPALTISAQVLFGAMLGALGVIFATPLTAMALVLVNSIARADEPLPVSARRGAPPRARRTPPPAPT